MTLRARLETPDATEALGRRVGRLAMPGLVVGLTGDLGAGKSVFARGVARGLGIEGRIPSPTFILLASYPTGRIPLHHADLYRLTEPDEAVSVGLDDVFGRDGVCVVEWADRFPELLPADLLDVRLKIDGDAREVELRAGGPLARAVLDGLAEVLDA